MEIVFEILKIVLPAILTGLSTFFITKYTYNKNIPLDKLEISYNRIYYPLYEHINNKNDTSYDEYKAYLDSIIDDAALRIKKYHKYVDRSTLNAFNLLLYSDTQAKKEENFEIFKNNIFDRCAYLRRRLGYLEPNLLQLYRHSSNYKKFFFRMLIEFSLITIFIVLSFIFTNTLQKIFIFIAVTFLCIFIVDIDMIIVTFLFNRVFFKILRAIKNFTAYNKP